LNSCKNNKNEPDLDDSQTMFGFFVSKVEYKEISREITGLGSLSFYEKASIISLVDGIIEKIYVKKGDKIKKGQLLIDLSNYQLELEKLKIENQLNSANDEIDKIKLELNEEEKSILKQIYNLEKLALQLEKSEAELKFLQESFEKKKELYEKGGMTEEEFRNLEFSLSQKAKELEIARREYEISSFGFRDEDIVAEGYKIPVDKQQKIQLLILINTKLTRQKLKSLMTQIESIKIEQKRINWLLEKCHIRSPIDGVVTDITKFVGEKVKAEDELTTIINLSYLFAKVSLSENDLGKISKGLQVKVYIDSINKNIIGTIHTIDPYIDPNTRTFSVDCMIKNSYNLLPGMFIKVYIPGKKTEKLILVPKEAIIVENENNGYVFIVNEDHRIFKRQISYEKYDDDYYIVVSGLNKDDIVVLHPVANLKDGTKIKVISKGGESE
ncbi:MAG: efflux RND transporter periplasmic adaptor subunit, partial [Spirochaetota bacterium]